MEQIPISSVKIEYPSYTYSSKFETNTSSPNNQTIIQIKDNPISIDGDTIKISGDNIQINRIYPFEYKGKKFLLYKSSKNVTEIYKIK